MKEIGLEGYPENVGVLGQGVGVGRMGVGCV